nr:MAG TPA: hypothetical protein [Caudoviricetes sp.]
MWTNSTGNCFFKVRNPIFRTFFYPFLASAKQS